MEPNIQESRIFPKYPYHTDIGRDIRDAKYIHAEYTRVWLISIPHTHP